MLHLDIDTLIVAKQKRERRTVTKRELARYCGVTPATVSNWSSPEGIEVISFTMLSNLMKFFDLQDNDLPSLLTIDTEDTRPIRTIDPNENEAGNGGDEPASV